MNLSLKGGKLQVLQRFHGSHPPPFFLAFGPKRNLRNRPPPDLYKRGELLLLSGVTPQSWSRLLQFRRQGYKFLTQTFKEVSPLPLSHQLLLFFSRKQMHANAITHSLIHFLKCKLNFQVTHQKLLRKKITKPRSQ